MDMHAVLHFRLSADRNRVDFKEYIFDLIDLIYILF